MKTILYSFRYLLFFQCVLALATVIAWAQTDPKVLIGTWDGWVEGIQGERGRTMIINSVKPREGGGWVAQGRYGTAGSDLGRQTFDVSVQDGSLIVEFITSAKNPAKLKLIGDDKLEGTLNVVVKRGSGDRGFKLEKVAPKAGDVK